jgi:hypothetical protein
MRNIPLPPPSNEVVEYVRTATGVNEHRIKEAIKILKEWLKLQPHLPHDYGKLFQMLISLTSLLLPERVVSPYSLIQYPRFQLSAVHCG